MEAGGWRVEGGGWRVSSLELSDTTIHKPYIRALFGTASHFCEAVSCRAFVELSRNNLNGFKDFHLKMAQAKARFRP